MLTDNPDTPDLLEHIHNYGKVLEFFEQTYPPDFDLQVVRDMYDEYGQAKPTATQIAEQWVARVNGKTPAAKEPPPEVTSPTDPRAATPKPPLLPADAPDPRQATPHPPQPPAN